MTQSIQAKTLTLHDVKTKFNFQLCEDEQFFREWIDDLPEISDDKKRSLWGGNKEAETVREKG